MADYMEATVSGKKWRRCYSVSINNPYNGQPSIVFQEEDVVEFPGSQPFTTNVGPLEDSFNPYREIELLDPFTGQSTGQTIPEGLVYQVLFSKYMSLAAVRDSAEAERLRLLEIGRQMASNPPSVIAPDPEPEPTEEPVDEVSDEGANNAP